MSLDPPRIDLDELLYITGVIKDFEAEIFLHGVWPCHIMNQRPHKLGDKHGDLRPDSRPARCLAKTE